VVSHRPVNPEGSVHLHGSPCGICSGRSGTGIGFASVTSVLPGWYYSSSAMYSYIIHLPLTLHTVIFEVALLHTSLDDMLSC
jgi:hypothetical protein